MVESVDRRQVGTVAGILRLRTFRVLESVAVKMPWRVTFEM